MTDYAPLLFAFCCGWLAAQPRPTTTRKSARQAQHFGISEGVRTPPHRPTRAEQIEATDRAFGLIGGGR